MGLYLDQILPRVLDLGMNNRRMRALRDQAAIGLTGTVVELGFGSGLNLPHYPEAVERLYAIDPATVGRRLARRRIEAAGFPVEFPSLDGERIALDDSTADCVLVTWSMCTIPRPSKALEEAYRVLKPGGTLHFVEHGRSPDPAVARQQDRVEPWWGAVFGGCSLIREVDVEVREAGFVLDPVEVFHAEGSPRFLGATRLGKAFKV